MGTNWEFNRKNFEKLVSNSLRKAMFSDFSTEIESARERKAFQEIAERNIRGDEAFSYFEREAWAKNKGNLLFAEFVANWSWQFVRTPHAQAMFDVCKGKIILVSRAPFFNRKRIEPDPNIFSEIFLKRYQNGGSAIICAEKYMKNSETETLTRSLNCSFDEIPKDIAMGLHPELLSILVKQIISGEFLYDVKHSIVY